jgi:hypothetical protein
MGHLYIVSNAQFQGLGKSSTNSAREDSLVVNVALNPAHQMFDICRSRHLRWAFKVLRILPQVLKFICRLHLRAGLGRAELRDRSVEKVDVIVEIHH